MAEYIEREVLLNKYKKWLPQLEAEADEGDRRGVETCIAVLQDIPAADVAEVKHGRWVSRFSKHWKGRDECGECGFHEKDHRDLSHYNYCPNCGARMDGE